jgi:hypothetical protein
MKEPSNALDNACCNEESMRRTVMANNKKMSWLAERVRAGFDTNKRE